MQEEMKMFNFDYEFLSPVDVDVEETSLGVAMITGTLLAEGISRNKNWYTVDVMESIAKSAEGVPIYVGTMTKEQPDTGLLVKNAHANVKENLIGKIVRTVFDPVTRKIKFWASLINTPEYPKIIEEVKQGWGVSIGGKAQGQYVIDSFKRIVTKILSMTVNHVQLIAPSIARGQDEAQVEDTIPREIQETMIFYELPKPVITKIKLGAGIKSVKIVG